MLPSAHHHAPASGPGPPRRTARRRSLESCLAFLVAAAVVRPGGSAGGTSSMKSAARGMQRELDSENKGFQMLKKMGWQSGAIGQSQDGLVEPIDPLANPNALTSPRRSGIGTDSSFGFSGGSGRRSRRLRGSTERDFAADISPSAPSRSHKKKQVRAQIRQAHGLIVRHVLTFPACKPEQRSRSTETGLRRWEGDRGIRAFR